MEKIEEVKQSIKEEAEKKAWSLFPGDRDQVLDDIDYYKRCIFLQGVDFVLNKT
ncbi:MAG: hypothetical protein O9264_13925 [Leptospira sp.]|nr:hypothetical protein [Leptospira sp.]